MKRIQKMRVLALFLFTIAAVHAQESENNTLSLTEGNVNDQFEYVYQKSNNYQNYKVVKKVWLTTLKKNVIDSLNTFKNELAAVKKLNTTQKGEINKLNDDAASLNTQLTQLKEEKDSISFFGLLISKQNYKSLMWGLVFILLAVLFLFIYKFRNANKVTVESRNNLKDIEEEYEEYRRNALEREQKARRQLQDEINKQKLAKAK
ncbi:tRNA (guanine-N1)-methyltransferase [Zhouia spongiae]|uniref:tRNA (Guanine-N1)-methyltransferase n=1 Tax=Zhouia spongiae TaxID=2202721 RepID=A0ABY3YLA6_9FLAO|nr:tRNA (guanine-N1)-methyltransferase [Zhouia spongiae]UNY98426.1 tRNA (guanine-N1)-methyltransferase [Zhouia spongiae]